MANNPILMSLPLYCVKDNVSHFPPDEHTEQEALRNCWHQMVGLWPLMQSDSQQKLTMWQCLIQDEAELLVQMLGLISSVQFDQLTLVQPSREINIH
jgi:hypothetical protein